MGSKSRVAKYIVPIIQKYIDNNKISMYIEPFCGGCNIIDKINCDTKIASDSNEYLIELFKYLQNDGKLPESISREEYSLVRSNINNYPKWYVGAVGFLSSYNGRFFDGGYAGIVHTKYGTIRNYYDEAKRNIESQIINLISVDYSYCDYIDYNLTNSLIYCDPPYQGVKKYNNSKSFDYDLFWNTMREWSQNNIVLISELNTPNDFNCIWEQELLRTVDNTKRVSSVEKLFIYKK